MLLINGVKLSGIYRKSTKFKSMTSLNKKRQSRTKWKNAPQFFGLWVPKKEASKLRKLLSYKHQPFFIVKADIQKAEPRAQRTEARAMEKHFQAVKLSLNQETGNMSVWISNLLCTNDCCVPPSIHLLKGSVYIMIISCLSHYYTLGCWVCMKQITFLYSSQVFR